MRDPRRMLAFEGRLVSEARLFRHLICVLKADLSFLSQTSEEPFFFSKLEVTDSDELACFDEQVIKNLGTLQIHFHRVTEVGKATFWGVPHQEAKKIHEKSKKAQVSHQASCDLYSCLNPTVSFDVN